MEYCIVDAGYKTPAIAKLLLDDGVKPVFPYKRPMTKIILEIFCADAIIGSGEYESKCFVRATKEPRVAALGFFMPF